MTTINERIKLLRKDNNLTQKQFADRILVTQSYLSRIESGKEIPNEKLIKLIALEFDVPTYWLRTGKGSKLINQDINDYFERGYNKEHQERLIVEIEEFVKFLQTQTVGIISINVHALMFEMKNYLEKSDPQSNSIHIIVFEKITSAMIQIFEKLKKCI